MKITLFSAVLLSIGWMSVVVTGDGPPPDCCLIVSNTRIHHENITKYDIQEKPICNIRAVRFLTKKNTIICSDPESNWAKKIMKIVDGRATIKPIKPMTCFTSTTNMIPTTTTTNKTPTPETETSTSTTEPPKVTEISTTTTQQSSVSEEKPKSSSSTAKTCGTRGPAAPPTETTPGQDQTTSSTTTITETTSTATTTSPPKKIKLSPLLIKKRRKSKKQLHKYQSKPKG